jgi:ABC-type Mn2+/Zn2+ transport system ATPase subunit
VVDTGALITIEHLTTAYAERLALDDVSLELFPAQVLSLVGPNGAGKSTLLKTIARMNAPERGTLRYAPVLGADPRGQIVYVPQRDRIDWTLPASVRDLVLMGTYQGTSRWRPIGRASRAKVDWALEKVGMQAHANTQIGRLSGGQQQRAVLARALVRPALVYLLDEPFTGVDAPTESIFEQVITELRADGASIVLATHNLDCARAMGDRACVLNRRVVALGPPSEAMTPLTIAVGYGDISALHVAHSGNASVAGR